MNAAAAQQRAAAARLTAARKAKPHPKAHKAKRKTKRKAKHKRAKSKRGRTAVLLAVAAHLRAEHRAQARRRATSTRKARLSAASVTTMPSPLRIAGLALLALVPFTLIDGWLIWTDRRRRRVPGQDMPDDHVPALFEADAT